MKEYKRNCVFNYDGSNFMRRIIYRGQPVFIIALCCVYIFNGCASKETMPAAFEVLEASRTGLDFENKLTPTSHFNVFDYMYYYNGAGVGAADFNNDGKIDLFFAANQSDDKLYLNEGGLHFKDVTKEAKIAEDGGWSTGVSVVDINNDGLLDIYICRVGNFKVLKSHNQLLICQGIDKNGVPFYKDEAHKYGLDFSGFSTQAAFFDYDNDGDLDMYLLDHSIHENGTYGPRNEMLAKKNPLSGDHLYKNNGNGTFTDVTDETGIHSSVIGYGLGIGVSDINLDGYPDVYVGNDFHENDYLYINQHNGTFRDELDSSIMHTSRYTMGVDVGDINNDGYPDIVSMDMLPSDPYILKRSAGEDHYDIFNIKLAYGYNYQYSRNNLQLNRRNGMFSEIGLYSGIAATDWSWSPLFMDFDNDGVKDLFISNGIPKRLNDIDYVNYISNDVIQEKLREGTLDETDMNQTERFPQIKIPDKFYRNQSDLSFEDIQTQIKNNKPTYSNGAVYADFDNDGDLDIVANDIDAAAMFYENKSNDEKDKPFLELKLKGPAQNINALGAKILVYANDSIRLYEKYPVHGFLSSIETPVHIGLYKTKIDSIILVWPDNTYQRIEYQSNKSFDTVTYKTGLPKFNYTYISAYSQNKTNPVENITSKVGLNYLHKENYFQEFNREPLIPRMYSTEGPALAVADVNHDGLDDVFIGSSKWEKSAIFLQQPSGKFFKSMQPALDNDSVYEDIDACWTDVNNDGNIDLVVASGGNEFYGHDEHLKPRVYLNDGKGNFEKLNGAFDSVYLTASCVVPYDFNSDGFTDLFIGARDVSAKYGEIPRSYLLMNDGTGKFKDVTEQYAKDLSNVGFVTSAVWFDIDKDGDKDLLISLEWGTITAFINNKGKFTKKDLTDKKGWWTFLLPYDIDGDGDIDIVAGNLGLNSRLKASKDEPVRLYYNDFDDNGIKEQILSYYVEGREIPFASEDELQKQMPVIKKQFLFAGDFAKASLNEVFTSDKLQSSQILTADYFPNAILINRGNLQFDVKAMPWQAQLSPMKDAVIVDANNDSLPDIFLGGNFYDNNIQMGRYDADYGTLLINKGKDSFECESLNGLQIKGQIRHIRKININNQEAFVIARNSDSAMVIRFRQQK